MNLNKRIIKTMVAILALFVVLVVYLNYFILFEAETYTSYDHNQRKVSVLRGSIYDRTGEVVLAYSEGEGSAQRRVYPFAELYAHTIGHSVTASSSSGLEKTYDKYLVDKLSWNDLLASPDSEFEEKGQDMQLTLDHGLTEYVDKVVSQAAGENGANVIVMNPRNGDVYCMYTKDSFDPNPDKISTEESNYSKNSTFDAVDEKFYPGSVFKIVTAATAIDSGYSEFAVNDTSGTANVGGVTFHNDSGGVYGYTDMRKAITKSSNVYFTKLSEEIGKENLIKGLDKFYITKQIPLEGLKTVENGIDISAETGETVKLEDCDTAAMAYAAFGQTPVKVSPLHMALAVSAIANDKGAIMQPHLVKQTFRGNIPYYTADSKVLSYACSARAARMVRSYMVDCIESGTGTRAKISGFRYGGKTGTAQNGDGKKSHAWFVGFAPAENPEIAFCVMVENGGYGGSTCGPIVKDIVSYCRENGIITR